MSTYTPFVDLIIKGQLKRVELKAEPTLKQAAESRIDYLKNNVNQDHLIENTNHYYRSNS